MTDKNIKIEPLARVEGHGGIKVEIKDNKISDVFKYEKGTVSFPETGQ